jgi:hypothetical protein
MQAAGTDTSKNGHKQEQMPAGKTAALTKKLIQATAVVNSQSRYLISHAKALIVVAGLL